MKKFIIPLLVIGIGAFILFALDDDSQNEILDNNSPFSDIYQNEVEKILEKKERFKYRIIYSIAGIKDTLEQKFLMVNVKAMNLNAILPINISETNDFDEVLKRNARGYHNARIKGLEYERDTLAYSYISHRWIAD